ncbi:MAG: ferritin-like domain-containing protein [Cohaesibacteraceae bacterium]
MRSLAEEAVAIVATADLDAKADLAYGVAKAWFGRRIGLGSGTRLTYPENPGRPAQPVLMPASRMPRRSKGGAKGRAALLHALAHIELNAVDLTWDMIARSAGTRLPSSYFDNWVQVGLEEAKHFKLLATRLRSMDSFYGALPAHAGLWEAAQSTGQDLKARLAIIPLVLEARGLDVTPSTVASLSQSGDEESADILRTIYHDEKKHVAFGAKWFRYLCDRDQVRPEPTFQELVRKHFKGAIKPPTNDRARAEAGLTPGFYKPLMPLSGH